VPDQNDGLGGGQPFGVLPLIVFLELATLDGPPPPFIVFIPAHRFGYGLLKWVRGLPAQRFGLGAIQRIPAVVAGPVGHALDERFRLAQEIQD